MLRKQVLVNVLLSAGIRPGDTLLIQSDLRRIGFVEGAQSADDILLFYYNAIREVITEAGTICVYTFFGDYGRFGVPFDRIHSPSRGGAFSEFIRTRPSAIRSIHPIVSLAAHGPRAEELCGGDHYSGFGGASPWARLHRSNSWLVALGLGLRDGALSFLHYVEASYGVPHIYNKLYDTPVFDDGKPIEGTFSMEVRYNDFDISYDSKDFRKSLVERKKVFWSRLGNADILVSKAAVIADEGFQALSRDRYAFLAGKPKFRKGVIPCDGPIG